MSKAVTVTFHSANALLHTGAGRLRGVMVSHDQATTQKITFYDNKAGSGTVLLILNVAPEQNPFFAMFPSSFCPEFSTGLYLDIGTNCDVLVWSVGFGA